MSYNYNEIAKVYDDVREGDFLTADFLVKAAGLGEASTVLEIGCGTGNYLRLMQELTKGEIWGIDSSYGMLAKAKEKCKDAVLVEGDAAVLADIPDEKFDLVYMVDVIHHIKDIDAMFKSISRVLKPNAMIIILTDNHEHIRGRLTTKYFPETLAVELKRYQDTDEIKDALRKNSFRQISSGELKLEDVENYGPKLIEVARKKGYSMFGLITEEAIKAGIKRIERDIQTQPIIYRQKAPYIMAVK